MVPPGKFENAMALSDELEKLPLFAKHGLVFMSTVCEREERDQLMQYSENEFAGILARS